MTLKTRASPRARRLQLTQDILSEITSAYPLRSTTMSYFARAILTLLSEDVYHHSWLGWWIRFIFCNMALLICIGLPLSLIIPHQTASSGTFYQPCK